MIRETDSDIAVVIMSHKRHRLLKWCLDCLERNVGIEKYDFIIMQDGAVNEHSGDRKATDEEMRRSIEVAEESDLPNKEIRVQDSNIGIARMRDKLLRLLEGEYELIFQIENDIMLGKYALRLLDIMSHQFPDHVSTIYRCYRFADIPEADSRIDEVHRCALPQAYCFSIWDHLFERFRDGWGRYIDICRGYDYDNRPEEKIKYEMDSVAKTYSDAVMLRLLTQNHIMSYRPVISRANYYGYNGHYMNKSSTLSKRYGEEGPAEYPDDKSIEKFRIAPRL